MLLIEKVLILHSSEIFKHTQEKDLVELAGILEEIYFEPGVKLFSKGDAGSCMYFIFKGKIRIHDEGHTLATLGENEIVGELAILDSESRSATATTMQECILLKLDQEPFYDILLNNVDILKGILKTLCKRLRLINKVQASSMGN
jgi:CRP-like cAMP-binding protein